MTSWEGRRPVQRVQSWLRDFDAAALVDLLQNAKTVLAGVLAWVVATNVLGLEQAFLAPWSAVLVVHATVYRTVSRGGQQVAATFLGVFLAWACGQLFETGPLGMGVMLAVSFALAQLRWMRDEGTSIATTGIVVLATNAIDQSNLLTSRLLDTTVGIVVGLAVNLLVWPPLRDRAAWTRVHRLPGELADILEEMASGLGPDLESSDVDGWVKSCRVLDVRIDEAWGLVQQAQESSRLNPRRSQPAGLDDLVRTLHLLEQAVADTLSMARTVAISADQETRWDDQFRSEWKQLLGSAASATEDLDAERLAEVREELTRFGHDLSTDRLAHAAWHEYGGLLVNLRNVVDGLTEVVRWSREAGDVPARTTRYDVPKAILRADRERAAGHWTDRLPVRSRGYVDADEHSDT